MATTKQLLMKLNEWKEKQASDVRADYEISLNEWDQKYTGHSHQVLAGKAHKVLNALVEMGGYTKTEYDDAMKCFLIAVDGRKYLLDIKKAFKDFGLDELKAKFTLA